MLGPTWEIDTTSTQPTYRHTNGAVLLVRDVPGGSVAVLQILRASKSGVISQYVRLIPSGFLLSSPTAVTDLLCLFDTTWDDVWRLRDLDIQETGGVGPTEWEKAQRVAVEPAMAGLDGVIEGLRSKQRARYGGPPPDASPGVPQAAVPFDLLQTPQTPASDPYAPFQQYQEAAERAVAIPGHGTVFGLAYGALTLSGTVGRIAKSVQALFADTPYRPVEDVDEQRRSDVADLLADALFCVTRMASDLGYGLDEIAARSEERMRVRGSE